MLELLGLEGAELVELLEEELLLLDVVELAVLVLLLGLELVLDGADVLEVELLASELVLDGADVVDVVEVGLVVVDDDSLGAVVVDVGEVVSAMAGVVMRRAEPAMALARTTRRIGVLQM